MSSRTTKSRFSGVTRPAHRVVERTSVMGLVERLYAAAPPLRRAVYRTWYHLTARFDRGNVARFANYGYAEVDPGAPALVLDSADEPDRLCIQLYHHVAAAVDLAGCDVLEIGSGRGGGADYIARYLKPRSTVGVDTNVRAIQASRRHYRVPGLRFGRGDSESLPFAAESFDAVVNVESSHCYGSVKRFLSEVRRVLRPEGVLLLADFRASSAVGRMREQFEAAGFVVERETSITPNVFRALELDNERKLDLIHKHVPTLFRAVFCQFAATSGTPTWEKFRLGRWEYLSYVLRKPRTPSSG